MDVTNFVLIVSASLAIAAAEPVSNSPRVIGGLLTAIEEYPFLAAVLRMETEETYLQACSGAIINNRNVISAAHCYRGSPVIYRIRVGSSFANSGGDVYNIHNYTNHPEFNWLLLDNDISLLRTAVAIVYKEIVQRVPVAGANYHVNVNSIIWIVGWGRRQGQSANPVQLRHDFQMMMNQATCRVHYSNLRGITITDNMFCGSWFSTPVQRFCTDDAGGPVLHFNENSRVFVIIGVTAFNNECDRPHYPGVSTRLSRYVSWIQEHLN